MVRKCLAFALSAGVLCGILALVGPSLSRADDDESPLEKIMEKVQKHNGVIQKGVRSKPNFAKAQKDVVKSSQGAHHARQGRQENQGRRQEGEGRRRRRQEMGHVFGRLHQDLRRARKSGRKVGCHLRRRQRRVQKGNRCLRRLPQRLPQRRSRRLLISSICNAIPRSDSAHRRRQSRA